MHSSINIGWRFPPTGGGQEDDFNHPGIAHFAGDPISSLAREVIQNSLDAKNDGDQTVHVEFEIRKVPSEMIECSRLNHAMEQCLKRVDGNPKAKTYFENAAQLLDHESITFLRIADSGTTGLIGNQWHALAKVQGLSAKSDGAGGSHGIGKFAPFAISMLRTVMYWTCFEENAKYVERFQGKSILMSHGSENEMLQGVGFFGDVNGCNSIEGENIPSCFTEADRGKNKRRIGTSIWIAGFQDDGDWQIRIAASVIENYFDAILRSELIIHLEPNGQMEKSNLVEISSENLNLWISFILNYRMKADSDIKKKMKITLSFCELLKTKPVAERQDIDLGHCKLWIQEGESHPSMVGLVRSTGMLITTRQNGLIRFNDLPNFLAICRFESEQGNELLRQMENPTHDKFEPNRLPKEDQSRGKKALDRVTLWIRKEISSRVGASMSDSEIDINELARYLPDLSDESSFEQKSDEEQKQRERRFGERPIVVLKPIKVSPSRRIPGDIDDPEPGPDPEPNPRPGPNPEPVPSPNPKPSPKARRVEISDARVIPLRGTSETSQYSVSFTPRESTIARVTLLQAGDSSAEKIFDVQYFTQSGESISPNELELKAGVATRFNIATTTRMTDRAWIIDVTTME